MRLAVAQSRATAVDSAARRMVASSSRAAWSRVLTRPDSSVPLSRSSRFLEAGWLRAHIISHFRAEESCRAGRHVGYRRALLRSGLGIQGFVVRTLLPRASCQQPQMMAYMRRNSGFSRDALLQTRHRKTQALMCEYCLSRRGPGRCFPVDWASARHMQVAVA